MCNVLIFIQLIDPMYRLANFYIYIQALLYDSYCFISVGLIQTTGYSAWGPPSVDALGVGVILLFVIYSNYIICKVY